MGNRVCQINRFKDTKAQGTLETAIVFIIIILFLGGIIKIWFWANQQIVQRQLCYNASRVAAGTSSDTYKLSDYWPVYTPEGLSEEDVLLDNPLTE